ncbi:formylglycine-generating enzyme family protein [Nocardia sp. CDC159]|uniref:Formylglycine-generating enzyme family protein n=1 Tax=Nocardia pulmonis TaxID=2951408 RepID=A0A9X2ECA5_9NOCA|nr:MULTISPECIES: formylglycine-generating enzyme family protein [Nocardia]MCM6778229.1 formylglycine-generating enzyme family protein [Nocardia pulmonis]MCM6791118.1 formylglycine-generating enzyme family protein [Nocardia sp. CDC159]
MADISPGVVELSDRRTRQRWSVEVGAYRLAVVPVTRAQYARLAEDGDRLPMDSVSWTEAIEFCNALSEATDLTPVYRIEGDQVEALASADGFRLPTEAEWEYACRAGTSGPRYGPLDEIAWYRGNSGERPHPVATRQPNAWGLYDMIGNVWEWCWDRYDPEVYGDYRVLRGGGWFDEHWSCRAGVRRRSHPTLRLDDVGFRLARTILP